MLSRKNFWKLDSRKRHILHSLDRTQLIHTCILLSFSQSLVIHDSRAEVQRFMTPKFLKQRFMILTCFVTMIHDSWFDFHPRNNCLFFIWMRQGRDSITEIGDIKNPVTNSCSIRSSHATTFLRLYNIGHIHQNKPPELSFKAVHCKKKLVLRAWVSSAFLNLPVANLKHGYVDSTNFCYWRAISKYFCCHFELWNCFNFHPQLSRHVSIKQIETLTSLGPQVKT